MADDLVERLRDDNSDYVYTERHEAADRIQALEAVLAEARLEREVTEGRFMAQVAALQIALGVPGRRWP